MKTLFDLWQKLRAHGAARLVVLSVLVGIVAGLGALAFNFILDTGTSLFISKAVGYSIPVPGGAGETKIPAEPARRWLLLIVPAVGGLLSGLLVYSFAPEAEGHGTDAVIDAFHNKRGMVRKRIPLIKTIASALTIGSGGSAGREGPIAQIGAGFGSMLASWLKVGDRQRRILLLAGAGAGIGAVFRAPLGGALFAVEVLYREIEFESSALVSTFVASIVSYSIYCALSGKWGAIFRVPSLTFNHPAELILYLALGIVCALIGMLYVRVFYGLRDRVFRKISWPPHVKPALGGVAVGIIGFFLPQVLSMGYGWLQLAMDGQLSLALIIIIVFMKIVVTGFTIGSGGSGGVFAPSIVIGGLIGAAVGMVFHHLLPGVVVQPAAFILVGMAGFFAGVAKTPLSSLIMASEMTTGYGLLAPLMLTTAASYLIIPKRLSLYENQVNARIDSPAHEGTFLIDILERIPVREAIVTRHKLTVFWPNTPLSEILEAVANSQQDVFPVLNQDGTLHGVIYFDDIRLLFNEQGLPVQMVVAEDLMNASVTVVSLEEDLASALRKFRATMQRELPVVEAEGSSQVVGVIGRRDILTTYHDKLYRRVAR
jgi:CIC family chloride channel protein